MNCVSPNRIYMKVVVGIFEWSMLEISGPNITSLDTLGSIEELELKNLSSLVDATLDFSYSSVYCAMYQCHLVRNILEIFKNAKVLTICRQSILMWKTLDLMEISICLFHWKHLILNTNLTKWHIPGITGLLRSFPCLQMLDIPMHPAFCCFKDILGSRHWS